MKKLILKTALITLGAAIACVAILLVLLSYAAPKFMMGLTASMGMESVSGNYAYGEWERSGDTDCLARSFLIAANHGDDEKALGRWNDLYDGADFDEYCGKGGPKDEDIPEKDLPAYSYRDYLTGTAARVKYRLATNGEEKAAVLAFAIAETERSFPNGNPTVALAAEAMEMNDGAFLAELRSAIASEEFEKNDIYMRLTEKLEEFHE